MTTTEVLRDWKMLQCCFKMEDGARSQGMQTASRSYNRQMNDTLLETLGKKNSPADPLQDF